jgi:hypothetical protein
MENTGVGIDDFHVKMYMIMVILILRVEACTVNHWNSNELYRQKQHFNAIQQCAACFGSTEISSSTSITQVKKISTLGTCVLQRYLSI